MFHFLTRHTAWPPSERRRRQMLLSRPRNGGQATHPDTGLTDAEEAEVAVARATQSLVAQSANHEGARLLQAMARRRPVLIRRLKIAARRDEQAREATADIARFDESFANDGVHQRQARRMRRSVRNLLVVGLGLIDVFAFRAAIEYVFNTRDDTAGRAESLVLSLLSMGMIVATAMLAQSLRNHADRLANEELGLDRPGTSEPSRRELRWIGWPAGISAAVLLAAGSILRLQTMIDRPWWVWFAVPAFSTGAMASAFFVEWRWASETLDRRDDLRRVARRLDRRAAWAVRRGTRQMRLYEHLEQRLLCLADMVRPTQELQAVLAASRIAWGRAGRRAAVGPAAGPVIDRVRAMVPAGGDLIDVDRHLDQRGLRLGEICSAARRSGIALNPALVTTQAQLVPKPHLVPQLHTNVKPVSNGWPAPRLISSISRRADRARSA